MRWLGTVLAVWVGTGVFAAEPTAAVRGKKALESTAFIRGTISPTPLATARTDARGYFVLEDVPVMKDLSIVIQTGKWRREIKVDASQKCAENKVPDAQPPPSCMPTPIRCNCFSRYTV